MLRKYRIEDTFRYPKRRTFTDLEGVKHTFTMEHMILGTMVTWEAHEAVSQYQFRQISSLDENGTLAAEQFLQKIKDGGNTKSLRTDDIPAANLLYRNGVSMSLKDSGTIRILEKGNDAYDTAFEIDGQIFNAEDLGLLLGGNVRFTLQYQIQDASGPVLKENEYLMPVKITEDTLIGELQEALYVLAERGNFLSYKNLSAFELVFDPILEKLKVFARQGDRQTALETGRKMIRILMETDSDDDSFPEYEMKQIRRTVDPFSMDGELHELFRMYSR